VLGDNIIEKNIRRAVADFFSQPTGAKVLLKEVEDPQRFGVVRMEGSRIAQIVEKPQNPPSNLAVIGIYMYDNDVFDICKTLKPSGRGELEITDVNNAYLARGDLSHVVIDGWWTVAGTFDSLYRATALVAEGGANKMDDGTAWGRKPAAAAARA
jgi:glucose-1-phosphate thymidylyltransferase